ncbi:hypothetical protein DTO271G3_7757 [Paecilomyces variotii]|nr:hypothetical protein DTO271G3_7757 [Paecilomyces variotii]
MKVLLHEIVRPRYPAVPDKESSYLYGLRGVFVIESFLWVFLQTLVPGAVKGTANINGPAYQIYLKKTLSVLFWNDSLIYSFFILVSARTICLPFLKNPDKSGIAGSVFRRGLRLWFPVAVSLAVVKLMFWKMGTAYIDNYKSLTGNISFNTPYDMPNTLVYFNSVFNMFWITQDFATSAGSYAFPSQLLWIVNVIYMQSYTVYMAMLIIPYTRNSWRVKGSILFIITAWWVQSWAWFTVTGLILADMVFNMNFKEKARRGIPIWRSRNIYCPSWVLYSALMAAGLIMQFIWTGWKPQDVDSEIIAHAGLYYTGGLNNKYDPTQPQARDDIYLMLVAIFFAVETYDFLQRLLRNSVLIYLGSRSLSWLLVQSIIIYTAGIKLFVHLNQEKRWPSEGSVFTVFIVCLAAVVPIAELFYRLVEYPSRALAYRLFDWIRE